MFDTYAKIWAENNFALQDNSFRIEFDLSKDARDKPNRMESCDQKEPRDQRHYNPFAPT